jgi:signal peptidase I
MGPSTELRPTREQVVLVGRQQISSQSRQPEGRDVIGFQTIFPTATKVAITCAVAGALYAQPYRTMMFVGKSMEPTYHSSSMLLTEPVQESELRPGMVVVINMDFGPIVKRIAFVPGDKILQVKVGKDWMDMIYLHVTDQKAVKNLKVREFTVPAGEVYVLGDNQPVSMDSKEFGCVDTSRIQSKLVDQRPFNILCKGGCPDSWIQ